MTTSSSLPPPLVCNAAAAPKEDIDREDGEASSEVLTQPNQLLPRPSDANVTRSPRHRSALQSRTIKCAKRLSAAVERTVAAHTNAESTRFSSAGR